MKRKFKTKYIVNLHDLEPIEKFKSKIFVTSGNKSMFNPHLSDLPVDYTRNNSQNYKCFYSIKTFIKWLKKNGVTKTYFEKIKYGKAKPKRYGYMFDITLER